MADPISKVRDCWASGDWERLNLVVCKLVQPTLAADWINTAYIKQVGVLLLSVPLYNIYLQLKRCLEGKACFCEPWGAGSRCTRLLSPLLCRSVNQNWLHWNPGHDPSTRWQCGRGGPGFSWFTIYWFQHFSERPCPEIRTWDKSTKTAASMSVSISCLANCYDLHRLCWSWPRRRQLISTSACLGQTPGTGSPIGINWWGFTAHSDTLLWTPSCKNEHSAHWKQWKFCWGKILERLVKS